MKRYMHIREYCRETGFPESVLRRICHSRDGQRCCFRSSQAVNSPFIIIVDTFERMLEAGDLDDVING